MAMQQRKPTLSRRSFIATTASSGLIMSLGSLLPGCSKEEAASEMADKGTSKMFAPNVWFEVSASGLVSINIAKAEMGQHVGTALARVIADELGADWGSVSIKHVDTDPKWGYMITGGSWSVFTTFAMLSRAGAAGRLTLIDAGAALLGVDSADCDAVDGYVVAGDQKIAFGRIVSDGDVSKTFSDEEFAALPIKSAADRRLIGKDIAAHDIPAKSKGEAVYGLDAELPNMVYAHPLMPPTRYGSRITDIDDTEAKNIPGYLQTIQLKDPSEVIQGWALVIAESFPAAMNAAAAIKVDWDAGPTAAVNESDIFAEGAALVEDENSGVLVVDDGDVAAARDNAAARHSSTYRTASALHFPLEPANALVEFKDGQCHIHSGNQWQSLILPYLATALQLAETDIVIHQYYLGGGFGRRLFGDQMIPAALAARELDRPVKLVFSRAEDSRFDCIRSPSVCKFDASFNADGKLTGLEHAAAAGWPTLTMVPAFLKDGVDGNGKFDPFSISGADHWYTLPNHRVRAVNNDLAQRTFLPGYLRAVAPGWIGWGVECFMDELAEKAGMDPIEYRLALLDATGKNSGNDPESVGGAQRLTAVLKDVRDRSGWGRSLPSGEALGVAVGQGQERTMPTWTACVVHVAVDGSNNSVKVKKIYQTIDCGTVVHPDGAMAQAEGATLWGLSLALHEGTEIANGEVSAKNLNAYSPLRMADVPEMEIEFMQNVEFPTGLGEPPLIAVAPAIGNAIYTAIGKRIRDLPIKL